MTVTAVRAAARPARAAGTSLRPRRLRGDRRTAAGLLAPLLLGFSLFTVFPVLYSLVMSLYDWPVFGSRTFLGIGNYAALLQDRSFRTVLGNTALFVAVYVPANLAISLGISLWLRTPGIRGRNLYRVLFFLPAVTPVVANAVIWQLLFQPGGVAASLWTAVLGSPAPNFLGEAGWARAIVVLMVLWQGIGYNTLILSAGLDAMPEDVLEASRIDGAGAVRRLRHIVLPLISPTLFFAMVTTLIGAFQVFSEPFILTDGGPGDATESLVTLLFRTGFRQYAMGEASAIAWIVFLLIIVVTAVQFTVQRRWVHYDAS
ncbi:MAG TPA: sugar ABC transporter permease [Cellulomonas sp.]